jgi:protein-S-isoprenylcysteine O-methyltransferase Ste14
MQLIYIQLTGCIITVICSITLGIWLKRYPSKSKAVTITPNIHLVLFCAYIVPLLFVLFDENFTQYDLMFGLPLSGFPTGLKIAGTIILILGIFLVFTSVLTLMFYGMGLPGILLSEKLAARGLYTFTRNPMSLGFYVMIISIALLRGSIFFILWFLIVVIPTHICFLKCYEERELGSRFGRPYIEYKKRVPFLIPNLRNFLKAERNSLDV